MGSVRSVMRLPIVPGKSGRGGSSQKTSWRSEIY